VHKSLESCFSPADFESIEAAVTEAERHTDGEIAVAITAHSGNWLNDGWAAASLVGALAALLCLLFTHDSGWGPSLDYPFATLVGASVFVLTFVLVRLPFARTGTSKAVWKKALRHFHGLRPTRARTGVLLYISVRERQVAVVADAAIASKVSAEYWHTPRDLIVANFKSGRHAAGLIEAIEEIGARLAEHFPKSDADTDELANRPQLD
jgi:putative membrane protein